MAPPGAYRPTSPGATRVPSGNTMTHRDSSLIRALPWRITDRIPLAPLARSTPMARMLPRPQPKMGSNRSSRFSNQVWRGKSSVCTIVSKAEECFISTTHGSSGRLPCPLASQETPHSTRSNHRFATAQQRTAKKYRIRWGKGHRTIAQRLPATVFATSSAVKSRPETRLIPRLAAAIG